MSKHTRLTIYTDGTSRGNPGPASTGIHIVDATTSQTIAEFGRKLGTATNNEAEYHALFQAVEWLLEQKELLADGIQMRFCLDSELIVKQLQGLYKITEPRLKLLAGKVRSDLLQLPGTYTFEHIPREQNAYADRLANDALDK